MADLVFEIGMDTSEADARLEAWFASLDKKSNAKPIKLDADTKALTKALELLDKSAKGVNFNTPRKEMEDYIRTISRSGDELKKLNDIREQLEISARDITLNASQKQMLAEQIEGLSDQYGRLNKETAEAKEKIRQLADAEAKMDKTIKVEVEVEGADKISTIADDVSKLAARVQGEMVTNVLSAGHDIADQLALVFSDSQERIEQTSKTMYDFANAGKDLGEFFGAPGMVIGTAAGALAGYFIDAEIQREKFVASSVEDLQKLQKETDSAISRTAEFGNKIEATRKSQGWEQTIQVMQDFRKEQTKVWEESKKGIDENERKLTEMAINDGIRFEELISEYDAGKRIWAEITTEREKLGKLDEEMMQQMTQTSAVAIEQLSKLAAEATLDMDKELTSLTAKADLAAVPTGKLKKQFEDSKAEMKRLNDEVKTLRGGLSDVFTDIVSGDFDGAIKRVTESGAGILDLIRLFKDEGEKAKAEKAELDRRKAEAATKAKAATDAAISAQKDLNDLALGAAIKATKPEEYFPWIGPDAKGLIKGIKTDLLTQAELVDSLAKQAGETDKEYIERVKLVGKLSKDAKTEEVTKYIEGEKTKLAALSQTLDVALDVAESESEAEQKKVDYKRKLRDQELADAKRRRAEELALVEFHYDQEVKVFKESIDQSLKLAQDHPVKSTNGILSELELKQDENAELKRLLEEKIDLRMQDIESESEKMKLMAELAEGQKQLDRDLVEYKKQLLDSYTEHYRASLQPLVDIGTAAAQQISYNITNEKKTWDGVHGAVKTSISNVLKEKAKLWVGNAAGEGAAALGSLAIGDLKGAGLHGLAAAGYLTAAALAGYAGAKMAPKDEGQKPSSAGSGGASSKSDLSSDSFRTKEQAPVIVYLTGPGGTLVIPTSDPRHLADFGHMVNQSVQAAQDRDGV